MTSLVMLPTVRFINAGIRPVKFIRVVDQKEDIRKSNLVNQGESTIIFDVDYLFYFWINRLFFIKLFSYFSYNQLYFYIMFILITDYKKIKIILLKILRFFPKKPLKSEFRNRRSALLQT